MLKANDKIKVHLYDTINREIQTRHIDTVFTVYEKTENLELIGTPTEVHIHAMAIYLRLLITLQQLLFLRM